MLSNTWFGFLNWCFIIYILKCAIVYWGTNVWNIEITFVFFKKQIKDRSKNSCLVKIGVLGYKKHKHDSASCSD